MNSNSVKTLLILIIAAILLGGAFSGGIIIGAALPARAASSLPFKEWIQQAPAVQAASEQPDREKLLKPFWQAWDLMHKYYVVQPLDDLLLMQGAISRHARFGRRSAHLLYGPRRIPAGQHAAARRI